MQRAIHKVLMVDKRIVATPLFRRETGHAGNGFPNVSFIPIVAHLTTFPWASFCGRGAYSCRLMTFPA